MPDAWVYLLRCRDDSLYTGWTVDLERRLARHRAGTASRYTASRLPVALAAALPMVDRAAARREEARIKRLSRVEKLALVARAPADDSSRSARTPASSLDSVRMPSHRINHNVARVAEKVPGLRRVPVVRLLSAAEVAVLARDHLQRLSPAERRRLLHLVRVGRGRRARLTDRERDELEALVAKLEARRFVGDAVDKLSPVPLPHRLLYGPKH